MASAVGLALGTLLGGADPGVRLAGGAGGDRATGHHLRGGCVRGCRPMARVRRAARSIWPAASPSMPAALLGHYPRARAGVGLDCAGHAGPPAAVGCCWWRSCRSNSAAAIRDAVRAAAPAGPARSARPHLRLFMSSYGVQYYFMALYFQDGYGWSPLQAGLAFLPATAVHAGHPVEWALQRWAQRKVLVPLAGALGIAWCIPCRTDRTSGRCCRAWWC